MTDGLKRKLSREDMWNELKKEKQGEDAEVLQEVDEFIRDFIEQVRNSMEWGDKSLNQTEIEILFAVLNEQHNVITKEIRRIIDEFTSDQFLIEEEKKKKVVTNAKKVVKDEINKKMVVFAGAAAEPIKINIEEVDSSNESSKQSR